MLRYSRTEIWRRKRHPTLRSASLSTGAGEKTALQARCGKAGVMNLVQMSRSDNCLLLMFHHQS